MLSAVALLSSCNKEALLEINDKECMIEAVSGGFEATVEFTTNLTWHIEGMVDWIAVTPNNGIKGHNVVTINVLQNEAEEGQCAPERSATLTLCTGDIRKEIRIHQEGEREIFDISGRVTEIPAEGKTFSFAVEANSDYAVDSDSEWITVVSTKAVKSSEIVVTVAQNTTFEPRTGNITISGIPFDARVIEITQEAANRFASGKGTEAAPYVITTVDQLKAVGEVLDTLSITYFELGADIDLASESNWAPLKPVNKDYRIMLDGKNHTISNMYSSCEVYPGLFGLVSGQISNLKLDNCHVVTQKGTHGGVLGAWAGNNVASLTAQIENVHATNCVVESYEGATATSCLGGLFGCAGGSVFKNCSYNGRIRHYTAGVEAAAGGIVGRSYMATAFDGCSFNGEITVNKSRNTGGICGKADNRKTDTGELVVPVFYNCKTSGTITSGVDLIGGICAWLGGVDAKNCESTMTLNVGKNASSSYGYSGGIFGYSTTNCKVNVASCHYKGEIKLATNANVSAGIMGQTASTAEITDCVAEGSIKGDASFVASVLGYGSAGASVVIRSCRAAMDLTAKQYVGGIFGQGNANLPKITIDRCSYVGDLISTGGYASGIAARDNKSVLEISDCFVGGSITSNAFICAGVDSDTNTDTKIYSCLVTANISAPYATGGICGRCCNATNIGTNLDVSTGNVVKDCIVWSAAMTSNNKTAPSAGYSSGAIVGFTGLQNIMENCVRRPDMAFDMFPAAEYNVLTDNENASSASPLTRAFTDAAADKFYAPYNGKAAAVGETPSAVAVRLGWSADKWDLSKDIPVLK